MLLDRRVQTTQEERETIFKHLPGQIMKELENNELEGKKLQLGEQDASETLSVDPVIFLWYLEYEYPEDCFKNHDVKAQVLTRQIHDWETMQTKFEAMVQFWQGGGSFDNGWVKVEALPEQIHSALMAATKATNNESW